MDEASARIAMQRFHKTSKQNMLNKMAGMGGAARPGAQTLLDKYRLRLANANGSVDSGKRLPK